MSLKVGSTAVTAFTAPVTGCALPPPSKNPPTQVQVNFNFTPQGEVGSLKSIDRGAISGVAQHVGFYYSVNPDCSSNGLVQTQLKSPPKHGSVVFVEADGYTNFSPPSPDYECNSKKSPGVEVLYTSAKDFVGTDQFTAQGIAPKGKYLETDFTVKVLAPLKTQ